MNITVLGAGAMGSLFGGYLSRHNKVWLVDVDAARVQRIAENGVRIRETDGSDTLEHPSAVSDTRGLPPMDLVIVFVKAMFTVSALETNRHLIGKDTYLLTLQNGAGHEAKLLPFADADHVVIGTTQHNSSIIADGYVNHGGGGKTFIGLLNGNSARIAHIAENLTDCGFSCQTSDDVKKQIWHKLFINTAASSLTAVLQVPLGFIYDDPYAHSVMLRMMKEAAAVANAEGYASFEEEQVTRDVEELLKNAKGGYTSIYADIKNGNRTEVDTISGSVVDAAHALGVSVPCHEIIVNLIHALENRNSQGIGACKGEERR